MLNSFDDLGRVAPVNDAKFLRNVVDDYKSVVCCEIRDDNAFEALELSGMKVFDGVFGQISVFGQFFQVHPFANSSQIQFV